MLQQGFGLKALVLFKVHARGRPRIQGLLLLPVRGVVPVLSLPECLIRLFLALVACVFGELRRLLETGRHSTMVAIVQGFSRFEIVHI